jgi:hypothetical protein
MRIEGFRNLGIEELRDGMSEGETVKRKVLHARIIFSFGL